MSNCHYYFKNLTLFRMLYTFVEEQKKKKIHVAATYFVSGMCKSVDGCQVQVQYYLLI